MLDLKQESDSLYAGYLGEAIRLSLLGFAALTILLLIVLRSRLRVARVLAPLVLAVLLVAAGLERAACAHHPASGRHAAHRGGGLKLRAVLRSPGHAREPEAGSLTLASLLVANASTVVGFGLLSFSQVPVLITLGTTVAPGAFLALVRTLCAVLLLQTCIAPAHDLAAGRLSITPGTSSRRVLPRRCAARLGLN